MINRLFYSMVTIFFAFNIYDSSTVFSSSGKIDIQDSINTPVVDLNHSNVRSTINNTVKTQKRNIIDSDGWIRVGVLLPLSGKASMIGKSLKQAMQIALFSSENNKIILQFYDTNSLPLSTREITKQAISERVDIILGPLFGKEIYDVVKIAKSYDIPVISFSNDERFLNSSEVCSINYLISQEIDQIIGFASSKGYKNISVIIPEDLEYDVIENSLKKSISKYSSNLHSIEKYKKGDQLSISEAIKKITNYQKRNSIANKIREVVKKQLSELSCNQNEKDFDTDQANDNYEYCSNLNKLDKSLSSIKAVGKIDFNTIFVYGDNTDDLISIGSYLLYYDVNHSNAKIIGTSVLNNKQIFTENGYYSAWFTDKYSSSHSKSFENEYVSVFNTPPSKLAKIGYDAISVIASSSKNGNLEINNLNNPGGFFGISGLFKFMSDGTSIRAFEIKEISNRTSKTILPSVKSFNEMHLMMQNNIDKSKSFFNLEKQNHVDFDWILDSLKSLSIEEINNLLIES